jgi:hypothetical protein
MSSQVGAVPNSEVADCTKPDLRRRERPLTEAVSVFGSARDALFAARREVVATRPVCGISLAAVGIAKTQAMDPLRAQRLAQALARAGSYGQVLLCAETAQAFEECGVPTSALGEHVLAPDLPPLEVFEMGRGPERAWFPPTRSFNHGQHNLSSRATPFFGRYREVESLRELLQHNAVVTILGEPGVGKSSLAWRVGIQLLGDFPLGVWRLEVDRNSTHGSLFAELHNRVDPKLEKSGTCTAISTS